MAATTEHMSDATLSGERAAVRVADGARMMMRGAKRLTGAGLLLAAVLIWLIPGANWATELMLFKLTLSLAMGFSGLALWQLGANRGRPEIEIDVIRREVRMVRVAGRQRTPILKCKFSELSRAERVGQMVRLWDAQGTFLAEVALCNATARKSLLGALRSAGKLA